MDALKAAVLLFLAVLVQVSILGGWTPLGGSPDFLLVVLLSIALLRGSVFGAIAGFGTGFLLDIATLGTLGFTSLLLTVAGFWIGRYGETTARDRFHAPLTSVGVVTVLYATFALALRFVLGNAAPQSALGELLERVTAAVREKLAALSRDAIARLIKKHDRNRRLEGFLKITQAAQTDALVRVLDDDLTTYLSRMLQPRRSR